MWLLFLFLFPLELFAFQGDYRSKVWFDEIHQEQVLRHFSEIIFQNSFCRCQGNNGCTRGCWQKQWLGNSHSPSFRKCVGKKSVSRSLNVCARHVNGAIMNFIHKFFTGYCENTEAGKVMGAMTYQKCVLNFGKDVVIDNISLCRHGFIFPSAYCMLNLNGQSAHLYKKVPYKN